MVAEAVEGEGVGGERPSTWISITPLPSTHSSSLGMDSNLTS
jgi:hypothetical protein